MTLKELSVIFSLASCSLLATVPQNILDDSAKIVEAVEGSFQAQPAVPKEGSDKQLDQLMQLVPTQAN